MKKILFVIESLENAGGSERSLTSRANYLVDKFDYDITIVTTKARSTESFYKLNTNVKVVNIPIDFSYKNKLEAFLSIFFSKKQEEWPLMQFIHENEFQICSSFGAETFLYRYKSSEKVKFIRIKENRFTYKKLLGDEKVPVIKKIWRYLRFYNSLKIQKKMDYIITLTEEEREFWKKYLKNILVMPNFINLNGIVKSHLDNKIVIAVGRLEKEKGFKDLIDSFKLVIDQVPEWTLEIYGEGSEKEVLSERIEILGLTNQVFLKGSVKNINEMYQKSSIYVHTAIYEGFGNTILEAMSYGLPVVAFESVGGVKVLIKDNFNGFIVSNRNVEIFAKKVLQLINSKEIREKMGQNSIKIATNYSEQKVMSDWHQFYTGILGN